MSWLFTQDIQNYGRQVERRMIFKKGSLNIYKLVSLDKQSLRISMMNGICTSRLYRCRIKSNQVRCCTLDVDSVDTCPLHFNIKVPHKLNVLGPYCQGTICRPQVGVGWGSWGWW